MSNYDSVATPLTEIYLRNFKSVIDQRISLSALTLIIGPNSSGKTNLIRALLALSQSVGSRSRVDGFLLNGEKINLGSFSDVLHQASEPASPVSIGVSAEIRLNSPKYIAYPADYEYLIGRDELFRVQCEISFSGTDADDPMISPAQSIVFSVSSLAEGGADTKVSLSRHGPSSKPIESTEIIANDPFWPRRIAVSTRFRGKADRDGIKTPVSGADLIGLLPGHLIYEEPANSALAKAWVDVVIRSASFGYIDGPRRSPGKITSETLLTLATDTIDEWISTKSSNREGFVDFVVERMANADLLGKKLPLDTEDRRQELIEEIKSALKSTKKVSVLLGGPLGIELRAASTALQDLLGHQIWHLAGLREAPLPLYQASSAVRRGEIGTKGEYVAAALQALRDRTVDCPTREGTTERMSLRNAVQYWAEALELFSAVESHHLLNLGLGITVLQPGLSEAIDITSVGLGVSQLLPVLVRCLLASPGDVILLEQPELHLHPASQQRLADFLLACARSGRQLIIESHSEHLVNRLRLRAAQDESDTSEVARNIGVVFAERDLVSGSTTYRRADLNEFGGFDEWPTGFFGPGIAEAQQILATGLEKIQRVTAEKPDSN